MRKFLKIILILAGGVVALLILATIGLRLFFPSAKLRRLVEEQIRVNLHREAQLGGVSLGLNELTLERFRLSEAMSFSEGTFLVVDKVTVRWELLPLLSHKLLVKTVILENPQINVIRMADSKQYNISDLAGATVTSGKTTAPQPHVSLASSPTTAQGEKWSWRVDEIHLQNGTLRFNDRSPARQTSALSNIELIIRDFDPTRVQGHLTVGQIQNPVYTARDFSIDWGLQDIDPALKHLNGTMRLKQGPGLVQNLAALANSSAAAKLALLPLVMLQNIDKLGIVKIGLPDLSHLTIDQITGDYTFTDGTMKINTFQITGPQLQISALGTVQLASGILSVDAVMKTPQLGDAKLHISGTLSNPKTDLESLKKKAFKATIQNLLDKPDVQKKLNDTVKQLFR